jgi:hypothetical protein
MSLSNDELIAFLITAKLNTYASQGGAASVPPVLPGAHQLEFRQGEWFYRDIYYGMAFFIGQEMVYRAEQPFWSMVYAGGVLSAQPGAQEMAEVYGFLQAAMRLVEPERPFRGPQRFRREDYEYRDESQGDVSSFWGVERITRQGMLVYELRYNGGLVR